MNSTVPVERGRLSASSTLIKLLAIVAAIVLLAAACGDDSSDEPASGGDDAAADATAADDSDATAADDGEDAVAADDDDAQEVDVTQGGEAGGAGEREICAIGGADAFFSVVKNGADAAGAAVEAAGSNFTWIPLPNYDNIGPDMVKLIEQAVAQNCTALAVPVWDGAAQAPALAAAIDAGVNVFMYNSGLPLLEDGTIAALGYFGTDEYKAGLAAGQAHADGGGTSLLCVNTQPGAVNWQQRCGGAIEAASAAGLETEELILPAENFGDAAAISAAVQAKLAENSGIDAIMTGSAADADAVAEALSSMGADHVAQGSWDVSANILNRIASGEALFAIDQQGWLQGWYAVSHAWYYDQYAILPATNVILTGPALITADNVATVQLAVDSGQR